MAYNIFWNTFYNFAEDFEINKIKKDDNKHKLFLSAFGDELTNETK